MDEAARYLLSQGILGVIVIGLVWWILRKDTECNTERKTTDVAHKAIVDALVVAHRGEVASLTSSLMKEKDGRIEDAKGYAGLSLQLQSTVITTVNESRTSDARVVDELKHVVQKLDENTVVTAELSRVLQGKGDATRREG